MLSTILKKKNVSIETKAVIMRAVHEILDDPDFGMELSMSAKARLHKAIASRAKRISFSAIKKAYA